MRLLLLTWIAFLYLSVASSQEKKPVIIGQKSLSTNQGKPITIQLTDLYVEEQNAGGGNGGGNNENDGDEDDNDGDDDDEDNDGDDDGNDGANDSDDSEIDDDNDEDTGDGSSGGDNNNSDDDEEENEGKENGEDKDQGKDKDNDKDRGKDKDKDKDKGKGKGKDRGEGDRTTSYPSGYTLEVFNGTHYSVSGTTVTPAGDFTGVLTVAVRVRNNRHASPKYDLKITVNAVNETPQNKPPVIAGQLPLATSQDTPLQIKLSDLHVTDQDDPYPQGFTLKVLAGTNYTFQQATVHPSPAFVGILTVPVVVNDGDADSQPFNLKITVTAKANVSPVITGQLPLTTSQGTPLEIKFSHLHVTDPDDQYPQGFSLNALPGTNYTLTQTTVQPAAGFVGILTVPVLVNDGKANSQRYDLKITVTARTNVAPVISGQLTLTTTVNKSISILVSHLTVTDPDNSYPADFTLKVFPGDHYTLEGNVVTPSENFTGTLTVQVKVNDGTSDSPPFDLKIQVVRNANVPPVITGQIPLSISKNQSVRIVLSHLLVSDADNAYPADFSLQVFPGEHYSVSENMITPAEGFTGDVFVRVAVHDGRSLSEIYPLKITVVPALNHRPVITGQAGIKIQEGKSIEIGFSHLVVDDNDDRYPQDFSLQLSAGQNYTLSGRTVTPAPGFLGVLTISVVVSDGEASSEPFPLKVEVVPGDQLEIVGQRTLEVPEDSSVFVSLSDLVVNDPDDFYPQGFTLKLIQGPNYEVNNGRVSPHPDFHGNLTVPVTVSSQGKTSAEFSLLVVVTPVNDAPELLHLPSNPVTATGAGPWPLATGVEVVDVDDDDLLFGEVGFEFDSYQPGVDRFEYANSESIHSVFDEDKGVLFLLGRAPLQHYQDLIRSLTYNYIQTTDSAQSPHSKKIYIKLNDGKESSVEYERLLLFETGISLEIPSAFTPNNDQANDTWQITLGEQVEQLKAIVRVYDKKGNMVFETTGLENEWDGHYGGSPLPADVYFYTIEMDLSYKKVNYKGIVAILR